MSHQYQTETTLSYGSNVNRLIQKEENRISTKKRVRHKDRHGYLGEKRKRETLNFFTTFSAQSPPVTVAFWTSLCAWAAISGWLACSLIGYNLCRLWKNPTPSGQETNLGFIFNTSPLNRWAVNVAVSFGVMVVLAFQTLWLGFYKYVKLREELKCDARKRGVLIDQKQEEVGHGQALRGLREGSQDRFGRSGSPFGNSGTNRVIKFKGKDTDIDIVDFTANPPSPPHSSKTYPLGTNVDRTNNSFDELDRNRASQDTWSPKDRARQRHCSISPRNDRHDESQSRELTSDPKSSVREASKQTTLAEHRDCGQQAPIPETSDKRKRKAKQSSPSTVPGEPKFSTTHITPVTKHLQAGPDDENSCPPRHRDESSSEPHPGPSVHKYRSSREPKSQSPKSLKPDVEQHSSPSRSKPNTKTRPQTSPLDIPIPSEIPQNITPHAHPEIHRRCFIPPLPRPSHSQSISDKPRQKRADTNTDDILMCSGAVGLRDNTLFDVDEQDDRKQPSRPRSASGRDTEKVKHKRVRFVDESPLPPPTFSPPPALTEDE